VDLPDAISGGTIVADLRLTYLRLLRYRHDKLHDRLIHSRGISMQAGLIADGNNTGTSLIEYLQSFTRELGEMTSENYRAIAAKSLILNGGQRRDRTADAGLFRAALYH
jgi:hypothetical protein